jgi:hypothetical protein
MQSIQCHGRLEKLSVYNNAIGSAGCQALVAAVRAVRALKVRLNTWSQQQQQQQQQQRHVLTRGFCAEWVT